MAGAELFPNQIVERIHQVSLARLLDAENPQQLLSSSKGLIHQSVAYLTEEDAYPGAIVTFIKIALEENSLSVGSIHFAAHSDMPVRHEQIGAVTALRFPSVGETDRYRVHEQGATGLSHLVFALGSSSLQEYRRGISDHAYMLTASLARIGLAEIMEKPPFADAYNRYSEIL
ncbi:MAG: hypothetical protein WA843_01325 [Candidatus Saccharimonadales bacterium]